MLRKSGFGLMFILVVLALASAQQNNDTVSSAAPSVTLKTTTHMVVLDVVVTNSAGHHAKDLQADDFTVTEDDVSQRIVSFEASGANSLAAKKRDGESAEALSGSPQTILVLDELDTNWVLNAQARWYMNKFLATHAPRLEQPTALLALTDLGLEMLCPYTRNTQQLATALNRHRTMLHIPSYSLDRFGVALTAMYQIAQASTDHNSRKNLIWIGPGFPFLNGISVEFSTRVKAEQMVQKLANALLDARIAVYTVNPSGLEVYPERSSNRGMLIGPIGDAPGNLVFEAIAPETGGKIFRGVNDVGFLVDKSIRDGARYYTLAYYPSNHEWNGKYRRISVRVNQPGLEVRTRAGYWALGEPEETPDNQIDLALSIAVRNPIPYTLIPVTLSAKQLQNPPHSSELTVSLDRNALYWAKLPNGDLRAEITLVTASLRDDNRVLKYKVREFESVVSKQKAGSLRNIPLVFTVEAEVPPKSSRIRCIVRDAQNEHMGTADLASNDVRSETKPGGSAE